MGLRHEDVGDDHAQGHAMLLLVSLFPISIILLLFSVFLSFCSWSCRAALGLLVSIMLCLSEFRITLSRHS